ncbi:serine/threonine-protein phosphatase 6 regulatory subunit 3-like [Zingiber officinale]|uniref:serine/threonine-protein phosphatase 6 regulatory subunit 3-like n=1 Tax=Zingiber officinale TaxID=94328 RepID=UPI001C4CD02C|nr:serine/threonine-protein phosphatase 6 regulatory subunit 3-like [Zingiber officinale]
MFWRIPNLPASSPVELILDKENFTLEELLDEEEIIQECKALNSRLINFLRERAQVEQLLRYIIEDAPGDADNIRTFKFPFVACEIFTCEIDVILKTLVEDEDLMNMLFSFLEPNRTHSSTLAGYFSKVVVCLMLRKTNSLMAYVQTHGTVFNLLADLIGITSIREILIRLVGADDHTNPNYVNIMQWLSDTNLLDMIVDKLSPSHSTEVNANAAEVLMAIIRNTPSALAAKLSSQSFITRIFGHALENSSSRSALIHSLSVCIALLDPKRSASAASINYIRNQHLYVPFSDVDPTALHAMLTHLNDLLKFLNVSSETNTLQTTYGELQPPLGKHRLKVVEFIAVLLEVGGEAAEKELIKSSAIQIILDLFFKYPFNNSLHHHVENLVICCLESKNSVVVDYLFCECSIITKFLQMDKNSFLSTESSVITVPASGRKPIRAGNIGHITRICNRLVQLGTSNDRIRSYLQESVDWVDWQTNVLRERNAVENVYHWACGRPTSIQERGRDSDEELHVRDYDVALSNNPLQPFQYRVYENDDMDEDVYLDEGSSGVVISSLRLGGDNPSCLFTNSNWFTFEDESSMEPMSITTPDKMDDANLNETSNGSDSSDDEVVVGVEELAKAGMPGHKYLDSDFMSQDTSSVDQSLNDLSTDVTKLNVTDDVSLFRLDTAENEDLFNDQQLPEWVGWREASDIHVDGSTDASVQSNTVVEGAATTAPVTTAGALGESSVHALESGESAKAEETSSSLFEDAEFVGVDFEEGRSTNGEVGVTNRAFVLQVPELPKPHEDGTAIKFNNSRWRMEPEVGIVQE